MRRFLLTVLLFTSGAAAGAALMAWRPAPDAALAADDSIVMPARSAAAPPSIPPPPPVPTGADSLPPLTIDLETTRVSGGRAQRTKHTFVRSGIRARVVLDGGRQEWLFVRNGVYPERVSGYLTDYTTRVIRYYGESPLRSEFGIRGWLDVLTVRFDRAALSELKETGERRQEHGTTFVRYTGAGSRQGGVADVWWSESLLLPLSLTVRDGETVTTTLVRSLTVGADVAVLADPSSRFPGYKSMDAADVEGH